MKEINCLISKKQIDKRIIEIASMIDEDYSNENLVIISILKGSICFTSDLIKNIKNPNISLDFIKISSYNDKTESQGKIDFQLDISTNIENKNVIIIDDILDSGNTMNFLYHHLSRKKPKTIKSCVLLNKQERRKNNIKADYVGFEIDNKFVIGYGLDFDEKYRNLPYIGYIEKK